MNFLTADWNNLIAINYHVDKKVLLPFLPSGTELDDFEGKYYVSVIGFMFKNTRVLGIKFPYHINFEEVNLRFYVKDKYGEKGVVFIKEIVPKRIIQLIANALYKEHYSVSKMQSEITLNSNGLSVKYAWEQDKRRQFISVKTQTEEIELMKGTKAEFIAEHYLGFTKIDSSRTSSYRVDHEKWKQLKVSSYELKIDFELNYGSQFSFLNHQEADSAFFLKGSPVSVSKNIKIH